MHLYSNSFLFIELQVLIKLKILILRKLFSQNNPSVMTDMGHNSLKEKSVLAAMIHATFSVNYSRIC